MAAWMLILATLAVVPAQGYELVKVAVVDTGLDLSDPRFRDILCPYGHIDFTGTGISDAKGHGTHVAGLIKQYAGSSGYCLLILKYHSRVLTDTVATEIRAIHAAVAMGADFVNISGGGEQYSVDEYSAIRSSPHVTFVVAAGNDGKDLALNNFYPASYRLSNVIAVGSTAPGGYKAPSSNFAPWLFWEVGVNIVSDAPCHNGICKAVLSGTSMSTAIHTGKLVKELIEHRKGSSGTYERQNLSSSGPSPSRPQRPGRPGDPTCLIIDSTRRSLSETKCGISTTPGP